MNVKNVTEILSLLQKKKQKGLSQAVIDKVVAFYKSLENGHTLPEKRIASA